MFYGRDLFELPYVLSYKTETIDLVDYARAILRTSEINHYLTVPLSCIEEPVTPQKILNSFNFDFKPKYIHPLLTINVKIICLIFFKAYSTNILKKHKFLGF